MSRLRQSRLLNALAILAVISFTAWAFADHLEVKNGSSWLEVKGDSSGNVQIVGASAQGASASSVNPVLLGTLDGSNNLQPSKGPQNITLLASALRTATTNSADQTNTGFRGIVVYLTVSAASGTGGLTVALHGKDPVGGGYRIMHSAAVPTAVTASNASPVTLVFHPTASMSSAGGGGSNGGSVTTVLPATWRVQVLHADGSNYTYSVSADLLP